MIHINDLADGLRRAFDDGYYPEVQVLEVCIHPQYTTLDEPTVTVKRWISATAHFTMCGYLCATTPTNDNRWYLKRVFGTIENTYVEYYYDYTKLE